MKRPKVLIVTSSLLTDRMIAYNDFLSEITRTTDVVIWATSAGKLPFSSISMTGVSVEAFPKVKPMAYKLQLLRRLNDFTWDAKNYSVSRNSFWKHSKEDNVTALVSNIRKVARVVNAAGLALPLEKFSERLYTKETRSPESIKRLQEMKPDAVIITSPFRMDEPGIAAAAKSLGIPTLCLITSWDNITTKNRLMFDYDGYFVWSEQMQKELHKFYPRSVDKPVYITGAMQYDVFRNERYHLSREEFLGGYGLDPARPVVLYTLGSPNLFDELPGAREFLKRVAQGELGDVQVILRPHPVFLSDPQIPQLKEIWPQVVLQTSVPKRGESSYTLDENQIVEWVNTFRHSDVVINLASTVTVDACGFDKPVVNIDFDPSGKHKQLIWEVNHIMNHFKPITESGGIWEVHNYDEMTAAVKGYLTDPSLHKEGRKWILNYVCGYSDGRTGNRFASFISDFIQAKNSPTHAGAKSREVLQH